MQIEFFYFVLILHLILGQVTKFLLEKLSTSEVISQKPHEGCNPPPGVLVLKQHFTNQWIQKELRPTSRTL